MAENNELLQQLQRKEAMFSQLGDFIGQMQSETQTMDSLKAKLVELEASRRENELLAGQLKEARAREQDALQTIGELRGTGDELRADIQRLNNMVVAEQKEFKAARDQWAGECSTLRQSVAQLRSENDTTRDEVAQVDRLKATNQVLNQELVKAREAAASLPELNRAINALQAQLAAVEKEKSDVSRHFWNVSEEAKVLKEKLDADSAAKEAAEARVEALEAAAAEARSAHREASERLQLQLTEAREAAALEVAGARGEKLAADAAAGARVAELESEINSLKGKIQANADDESSSTHKLAALQAQVDAGEEAVRQAAAASERLQLEVVRAQEAMAAQRAETAAARQERDRLQATVGAQAEQMRAIHAGMESKVAEWQAERARFAAREQERSALQQRVEQLAEAARAHAGELAAADSRRQSELAQQAARVEELEAELGAVKEQRRRCDQDAAAQITMLNEAATSLRNEVEAKAAEAEAARAQAAQLESSRSTLQADSEGLVRQLRGELEAAAAAHAAELAKHTRAADMQQGRVSLLENEKREILQEAETLNRELSGQRGRLAEVEAELRAAQAAAQEARRDAELGATENLALSRQLDVVRSEADKSAAAAEARAREAAEAQRATAKELKAAQRGSIDRVAELQSAKLEAESALQKALAERAELQHDVERCRAELQQLNDAVVTVQRDSQRQGKEAQDRAQALNQQARAAGEARQRAEQEKQQLAQALQSAQAQLQTMAQDLDGMREARGEAEDRLRDAGRARRGAQLELDRAQAEAARLNERCGQLEDQVAALTAKGKEAAAARQALERDAQHGMRVLQGEISSLKGELARQQQAVSSGQSQAAQAVSQLGSVQDAANKTIAGLADELKAAEAALGAERQRAQQQAAAHRAQLAELEGDMDAAARKHKAAVQQQRRELEEQGDLVCSLQAEMARFKESRSRGSHDVEAARAQTAAAEGAARESERRLAAERDASAALRRELDALRAEAEALRRHSAADAASQSAEVGKLEAATQQLTAELARARERAEWAERDGELKLTALQQERDELQTELGHVSARLREMERRVVASGAVSGPSAAASAQQPAQAQQAQQAEQQQQQHDADKWERLRQFEAAIQGEPGPVAAKPLTSPPAPPVPAAFQDGDEDDAERRALEENDRRRAEANRALLAGVTGDVARDVMAASRAASEAVVESERAERENTRVAAEADAATAEIIRSTADFLQRRRRRTASAADLVDVSPSQPQQRSASVPDLAAAAQPETLSSASSDADASDEPARYAAAPMSAFTESPGGSSVSASPEKLATAFSAAPQREPEPLMCEPEPRPARKSSRPRTNRKKNVRTAPSPYQVPAASSARRRSSTARQKTTLPRIKP